MPPSKRKFGQRRQVRSSKYSHPQATLDSHNSNSLLEGPISTLRPGGVSYSHASLSDNVPFDLQAVYTSEHTTYNRLTLSTKKQESPSGRCKPENSRRRPRSYTESNFRDLDFKEVRPSKGTEDPESEARRGEKWTGEEVALLRERRSLEIGESWDETGKYFPGRTTNALQKKYKLMILADKMQIEPELENQLLAAIAKHAPGFYQKLAMEINMTEDEVEIIEDKISILFMQGKLPIRSGQQTLISTRDDISSPIFQKARPASAPISSFFPTGPHEFPFDGSGFHGTLPFIPCPVPPGTRELRSPDSYSSDTEDGDPYHPSDVHVAPPPDNTFVPPLLDNEWHEEQHFLGSFLEDKTFTGFFSY